LSGLNVLQVQLPIRHFILSLVAALSWSTFWCLHLTHLSNKSDSLSNWPYHDMLGIN